ncbi:MAG: 50S ribosomal protein L33 [Candidatus Magasanikbacteria bacterium]|nr:50S ribosomal protein L33 [Candidatus Magasanikbacteria bacterium]
MAKVKRRIKLECSKCHVVNYFPNKSKVVSKEKLTLEKYCRHCRAHTAHKETK